MRKAIITAAVVALALPSVAAAGTPRSVQQAAEAKLTSALANYTMTYTGGDFACDATSLRRWECDIDFTARADDDVEEFDLAYGDEAECQTTAVVRRRTARGTIFNSPRVAPRYMVRLDEPDCVVRDYGFGYDDEDEDW